MATITAQFVRTTRFARLKALGQVLSYVLHGYRPLSVRFDIVDDEFGTDLYRATVRMRVPS